MPLGFRQDCGVNAELRTAPTSPVLGAIVFSRGKLEADGWFACVFATEADGETWEIELGMIEPYRADMLGFFEDLDRATVSGWEGELYWESEFAEVRIEAKLAAGADVVFDVLMRWPPRYEEERRATMAFRPADLQRLAGRMHDFLRMERGSRFWSRPGTRGWSPRPT